MDLDPSSSYHEPPTQRPPSSSITGPTDVSMRAAHAVDFANGTMADLGVPPPPIVDMSGGGYGQDLGIPPPPVMNSMTMPIPNTMPISRQRDNLNKELCVKVHIRRSGRDAWSYLGRAFVSQDFVGQSSRVVVRSAASGKVMTTFSELSDLHAEKRGNFVVLSCIEGSSVVSWSLNAFNNSETLKLLASIELACYRSDQATSDPKMHGKLRRRIERMVKEDRRRRHKRRREEEAMTEAFARQMI